MFRARSKLTAGWGVTCVAWSLALVSWLSGCQPKVALAPRAEPVATNPQFLEPPSEAVPDLPFWSSNPNANRGKRIFYDRVEERLPTGEVRVYAVLSDQSRAKGAKACAECHGRLRENNTYDPGAADVDFSDPLTFRKKTTAGLFRLLTDGIGGHPAYKEYLTLQQRWDVIGYLWMLSVTRRHDPTLKRWQVYSPESEQGQRILTEDLKTSFGQNCSVCHGDWGLGNGPLSRSLEPKPRNFQDAVWIRDRTNEQLFKSIYDGIPGAGMPPWTGVLTDSEVWKMIDFIRRLSYVVQPSREERAAPPMLALGPPRGER